MFRHQDLLIFKLKMKQIHAWVIFTHLKLWFAVYFLYVVLEGYFRFNINLFTAIHKNNSPLLL